MASSLSLSAFPPRGTSNDNDTHKNGVQSSWTLFSSSSIQPRCLLLEHRHGPIENQKQDCVQDLDQDAGQDEVEVGAEVGAEVEMIRNILRGAFAALIWTFTGDRHAGFLDARVTSTSTSSSSHGGDSIQDMMVREYDLLPRKEDEKEEEKETQSRNRSITVRASTSTAWDHTTAIASGSSLLIYSEAKTEEMSKDLPPAKQEHDGLTLQVVFGYKASTQRIEMQVWFDATSLEAFHVERYARFLQRYITEARWRAEEVRILRDLSLEEADDEWHMERRCRNALERVDLCIQDCVAEHVSRDATAIAVEAWDGRCTRGELDGETRRLAAVLLEAGVRSRDTVLVLMDKGRSVPAAILAILTVGAAFMLLDPGLPVERLKSIVSKTRASHAITTMSHIALACTLVPGVVVQDGRGEYTVADTGVQARAAATAQESRRVSPSDVAFYICTSGSSGTPKVIATSHAAWVTASLQSHQYSVHEATRVLQYASFSFAVSIIDMVNTLIVGGTVCIPGSQERLKDIDGAVRRLQPNFACITSSIAAVLKPSEAPSIRTLLLVGEPVPRSVAEAWLAPGTVTVRNGYGQSEACGHNSTRVLSRSDPSHRGIGISGWLDFWVVDPSDHNRLMPLGAVGELLIEGHSIAEGYLDDPEKTAAAFIAVPAWAQRLRAGQNGRKWYKTGDLVQYQRNGELVLLGRKDSQLKIYGQRVEAASVEYHISASLDNVLEVVVDKVGAESLQRLIAFISPRGTPGHGDCDPAGLEAELRNRLASKIPKWMIPTRVVLIKKMPRTATGKLDRRALKSVLSEDDHRLLPRLSPTQQQESPDERLLPDSRLLLSLCCQVLNIEEKSTTGSTNWIALGGDSLSAMALVRAARKAGISLTTADLMSGHQLLELCVRVQPSGSNASSAEENRVANALPLTDFQRMYLPPADGLSRGSLYKYDIRLRGRIDMERLMQAITVWFKHTEALRLSITRDVSGTPSQTVLEADSELWRDRLHLQLDGGDIDRLSAAHDFLKHPVLVVLHKRVDAGPQMTRITLHISHSIFEGISFDHLIDDFVAAYVHLSVPARPSFTQYLKDRLLVRSPESTDYWKQLLRGSKPTTLRCGSNTKNEKCYITRSMFRVAYLRERSLASIPMSTIVHASWAIVLSVLASRSDVMFLYLMHGRDELVNGSDAIIGCCTSEIPCRAQLSDSMTPAEIVELLRDQTFRSVAHAHLGSNCIASKCTDWAVKDSMYDHSSFVQHQGLLSRRSVELGEVGYLDVECLEVEEEMNYDFDLRTSSSTSYDVSFELRCLAALYSAEEVDAVAQALLDAVKLISSGEAHSVGEMRARIRSIPGLPIVAAS